MKNSEKKILILGLGSDVLMDDGICVVLMRDLKTKHTDPRITYETNLVGGMDIIERIRDYEKVILLDAMKTNEGNPGTVCFLNKENY